MRFTDPARYELRRLALRLAELYRSAALSGTGLKEGLEAFSRSAAEARRLKGRGAGTPDFLDALEAAGTRLRKAASDMELHGIKPDAGAAQALFAAGAAMGLLADFLARGGRELPSEAAAMAAAAARTLRLALRGARTDTRDFIPNLKFCTIYSDLEKAVSAVEHCAESLVRSE